MLLHDRCTCLPEASPGSEPGSLARQRWHATATPLSHVQIAKSISYINSYPLPEASPGSEPGSLARQRWHATATPLSHVQIAKSISYINSYPISPQNHQCTKTRNSKYWCIHRYRSYSHYLRLNATRDNQLPLVQATPFFHTSSKASRLQNK